MTPTSSNLGLATSKLQIACAFLVVLVIWSTTPLAIAKSVGGLPFTSALLRMTIGAAFCVLVLLVRSKKILLTRQAKILYAIGGVSIYGSMSLIYNAAQTIPSGWIAVLYGLSPIVTGLMSIPFEPGFRMTGVRLLGLILGLLGLYQVFADGMSFASISTYGITLVLAAVLISSASSVAMRQLTHDIDISGMELSTGGLIIAVALFLLTALVVEPVTAIQFDQTEIVAILYLGLIGSGIGFTLYFFLLKHLAASRVSLITLITPITSLAIGSYLNNEPLLPSVWLGAACVSIGLLLYEFKPRLGFRRL